MPSAIMAKLVEFASADKLRFILRNLSADRAVAILTEVGRMKLAEPELRSQMVFHYRETLLDDPERILFKVACEALFRG